MAEYLILDVDASLRRFALLDRFGGYHVALASDEAPSPGNSLHGAGPAEGLNLMCDATTGQVYRMVFEAVRCGQQAALERLHPPLRVAAPGAAPAALPRTPPAGRSSDPWEAVVPLGRMRPGGTG